MDHRARLTTFLKGIEPRAWVFLNVQCDDPARAAGLFRDSIRAFAGVAGQEPLARWPMSFWTILLSQPGLTAEQGAAPQLGGLARVPPGPRAVFLLPMVAGLDETHATQALGISSRALAAALVRARTAWPDAAAHAALRDLLQARIREPTAADRQAMRVLRNEALGVAEPATPAPAVTSRHRIGAWLAGIVIALLLAWLAFSRWSLQASLPSGRNEALPLAVLPALPPLDAAAIVTHPDYVALAAPDDASLASDLAQLSWFDAGAGVATAPAPADATDAKALPGFDTLPADERDLLAAARATWPGLDDATRQRLSAQARDWLQRSPFERAALRERMLAWDRLDATERARRRAPFEAWWQLPASDQSRLREAARRWAALPPAEQAAARAQFAQLPADEQRLWWLGPTLGRELAPIAGHYAFLPADQRDDFLTMLRGLDGDARADFSRLSDRLDAGGRERLRRELQEVAPEQRGAWLRARQAQ